MMTNFTWRITQIVKMIEDLSRNGVSWVRIPKVTGFVELSLSGSSEIIYENARHSFYWKTCIV